MPLNAIQKPEAALAKALLAGRQALANSPELAALFVKAQEDGWALDFLTASLAVRLSAYWGGVDFDLAKTVATVLAKEYFDARGAKGGAVTLVDPSTGLAVHRYGPEDVWFPAPVPREGGGLAQPLPRLRPELEGAIVHQASEQARVNQTVNSITEGLVQTEGQRGTGDTRLAILTREGRETFGQEFRERLHERALLHPVLNALTQTDFIVPVAQPNNWQRTTVTRGTLFEQLAQGEPDLAVTVETIVRVGVQDLRSINLRYDFREHLVQVTLNAWVQRLCLALATRLRTNEIITDVGEFNACLSRLQHPPNLALIPSDTIATVQRQVGTPQVIVPLPENVRTAFLVNSQVARIGLDFNTVTLTHVEYHDSARFIARASLNLWWQDPLDVVWYNLGQGMPEVRAEVVRR